MDYQLESFCIYPEDSLGRSRKKQAKGNLLFPGDCVIIGAAFTTRGEGTLQHPARGGRPGKSLPRS